MAGAASQRKRITQGGHRQGAGGQMDDPEKQPIDLSQLQTELAEATAKLQAAVAEQERLKSDKLRQADRAYKAEQKLKEKQTAEENALSDLQQQLEAARTEAEALRGKTANLETSRKRAEVFGSIAATSSKLADGAPKYLAEILLNRVGIDDDGEVVVMNEQGKRRLNPTTGKPMRPQELIDEILSQPDAKFLLKSAVQGGTGTHGRTDGAGSGEAIDLDKLEAMSASERGAAFARMTAEQKADLLKKAG